MQVSKFKLGPINIDDDNWYYEEEDGIILVHEVIEDCFPTYNNNYLKTDQIKIPWKRLLESVKRKYPKLIK